MRVYERELDIGVGNVVVLRATRHVPEYVMQARTGLDGDVTVEQVATNGVYLEPDALGELTTTLQMACRKAYKKQLKFEDEKAAASVPIWIFGYFCIAFFSPLLWWRKRPYVVAVLQAVLFFLGWYVSRTSVALLVILCPWLFAVLLEEANRVSEAIKRCGLAEAATRQYKAAAEHAHKVKKQTEAAAQKSAHSVIGLTHRLRNALRTGTKLYHQTDAATAKIILTTQEMKPGAGGLAGPGMYFATSKQLTSHKAHKHGVILEATVNLGRILTLGSSGDSSMTLQKLKSQNTDSVCIARPVSCGQEYVVYDSKRVLSIRKA